MNTLRPEDGAQFGDEMDKSACWTSFQQQTCCRDLLTIANDSFCVALGYPGLTASAFSATPYLMEINSLVGLYTAATDASTHKVHLGVVFVVWVSGHGCLVPRWTPFIWPMSRSCCLMKPIHVALTNLGPDVCLICFRRAKHRRYKKLKYSSPFLCYASNRDRQSFPPRWSLCANHG
jgi:hypothetical protein